MPTVKLAWKRPMTGVSSAGVAVASGCVVVADRGEKKDYWRGYDAATGKELWSLAVANAEKLDYGSAPRATPYIYRGRAYCLGALGDVHCLELRTGKVLWEKDYRRDFGAGKTPVWGHCTAPMVVEGKLMLHPGEIVALEPETGKRLWTAPAHGPNYSSFVPATFAGIRQLIVYDSRSLSAWRCDSGKRIWSLEVDNSKGYIVPAPVKVGEKLLVATEDEDTRLYALDKQGKLVDRPVAESEDLAPEMATPTVAAGLVLGICEGLICLDPQAGLKTLWIDEDEDAFYGLAHIVASKDHALVFGENGTMVLVAPRRKGCEVLGKARLCRRTWSHPALTKGYVHVRDEKWLYGYRLIAAGGAAEKAP
jgi:outer membrane protein assembly factor BamB